MGRLRFAVTTPSGLKPGLDFRSAAKLRMNNPALISNISDKAISDTTSRFRRRCEPDPPCRPPSFKASLTFGLDTCQAGARPNTRPLNKDRPRVKPSTCKLTMKYFHQHAYF